MGENFVFHDIFDTCDVLYNLNISLLPPIVLDTLGTIYLLLLSIYINFYLLKISLEHVYEDWLLIYKVVYLW